FRRIRKLIPNQQAIPVVIAELNYEDLDAGERQILDLVDDERTIEEIRLATHSSEFHVSRVFYRQWQEGRMKVVKARAPRNVTGATAAVATSTGAFTSPVPSGPPTAAALVDAAKKFLSQESFESALRHLRAARCLEPDNQSIGDLLSSTEKGIRESVESH